MLVTLLCTMLAGAAPHPEMQAILEAYAEFDFDALTKGDPANAQAIINAYTAPPSGIEIAEVRDLRIPGTQAAIPARLYHPAPDLRLPLVVYFHGGGWTWGTLDMSDPDVRFMAVEAGVAVLSVDYRVAPQHVFPAAVTDCIDATIWAAAHADELNIDPTRMAVAGDNALHGGAGRDTAVFSGPLTMYTVSRIDDAVVVTDTVAGRDGTDTLTSIEVLRFADCDVQGV